MCIRDSILCAGSNTFSTLTLYHISENGDISWSKHIPIIIGNSLYGGNPAVGLDNTYLVMYQAAGSGFYIWKGDVSGNEIFNRKIPTPNAYHFGTGLDKGEKYSRLIQVNDTLIVIQAVTIDLYEEVVENCVLRAVDQNIARKWYAYSTYPDSLHIEKGAGLFVHDHQQILFFGTRSGKSINEGFGDYFVRKYSLAGTY